MILLSKSINDFEVSFDYWGNGKFKIEIFGEDEKLLTALYEKIIEWIK